MVFINRKGYIQDSVNYYYISLYRYGELYKVIPVAKGSSVKIGSCESLYSDDTFYGWSKSATSTTRNYTATSSIKPTENLYLYAIFSYSLTSQSMVKTTVKKDLTTSSQTITISDARPNTEYTIQYTEITYEEKTSRTTIGTINGAPAAWRENTYVNPVYTRSAITSATTTSSTFTVNLPAYTSKAVSLTTYDAVVTTAGGGGVQHYYQTPVTLTYNTSKYAEITYYKVSTNAGTYYRVNTHDTLDIKLYIYGNLYTTLSYPEGMIVHLDQDVQFKLVDYTGYSDDTFCGWSISPTSTTISYRTNGSYTLTVSKSMDLYAVFSYKVDDGKTFEDIKNYAWGTKVIDNIDIPGTGTLTLDTPQIMSLSVVNGSGSTKWDNTTYSTSTTAPYINVKYNNKNYTGSNLSIPVTKGSVLTITMQGTGNSSSGGRLIQYSGKIPVLTTAYRVESHP